jgi:hypothetical protein
VSLDFGPFYFSNIEILVKIQFFKLTKFVKFALEKNALFPNFVVKKWGIFAK